MLKSAVNFVSRLGWRGCSTVCRHAAGKSHLVQRQVLPTDVVPKHYKLFLDPDLNNFTYKGEVEIDLDVQKPTNSVTLNILDLEIKKAALNGFDAVKATENKDEQQIKWEFPETLESGSKAKLKVEFDGILNDKLSGFYRSVYTDPKTGKQHVCATTQMEPTDCRRAFPCFDEPALKATFDISVAAEPHLTVLSNGSVVNTTNAGDKTVTHFETTPKMSTYLVAVIVGELNYVESHKFRVPVRVYATPGMEHRCQYSADLAAETLQFFEEKFGIAYPLSKCDMVGVHDFSAGAMENWGLITFRLADLFYTEGVDSAFAKCRVTEVVQHELAHQWFGNLVTMDWWDGLWLNEGFATWMSWYAGNHFNPDWKVWETYVQQTYAASLRRDSLRSSHAVEVPIARAQEVDQIFDAISYNKGSCVIRMISQFLGEDTFIRGVSLYLERHKYGNTKTTDLWNALSEVSGKDVAKFMGPWTREVGYPMLTVAEPSSENKQNGEVEVCQNRFLSTFDVKPEEDEVLWPISLEVRRNDGSVDHDQVLTERAGKVNVAPSQTGAKAASSFFKLNADQNGIYRVKYPDSILQEIANEGAKGAESKLSVEDKIGLLNDLNSLVGNEIHASQILTIAQTWKNDNSPNVVLSVLNALSTISRQLFFQADFLKDGFREFQKSIVVPLADKFGQHIEESEAGKDVLETELKATLFSACRQVKSDKYIKLALDMFAERQFQIPADFADAVYVTVAQYGSVDQWYELMAHYENQGAGNVMSGHAALFAVGRTSDEMLQKQVLIKIMTQDIKMQDASTAYQGLMTGSPESAELGWSWFTNNYEEIKKVFPATGSMLGRMVSLAITTINKPGHVNRVEEFFKDKDLTGIERVYNSSLDSLKASTSTIDSVVKDVSTFLAKKN